MTEKALGQRLHIDNEAVLHVALDDPVIGFVDLLDRDHLDVADDAVLGAEIEHLLGLRDATNERTREMTPREDHAEGMERQRLFRHTDDNKITVELEHLEIGVDVMFGGNGIEDEIEAGRMLLHLVRVLRDNDFLRAELERVLSLAG